MYCCQTACPGYIAEPYHIPGYAGHLPTIKVRFGASFGQASRQIMEDPCVAQAPCPILAAPAIFCPPPRTCSQPRCPPCKPNLPPCIQCCDPRAHHLNRGPYMCPCPEACPDPGCCEPMNRWCGWPRRCC